MKVCGDYHVHTTASDGRCSIFSQAQTAQALGLKELAITDHSFASLLCHLTRKKLSRQKKQISSIDADVRILLGVEANLIAPNGQIDLPDDVISECDVLHVGFHRFIGIRSGKKSGAAFKWLFLNGFASAERKLALKEQNTLAFIEAMRRYPIDCIAHLGHRTPVDFGRIGDEAVRSNVYIELNEKHLDALAAGIKELLACGVNFLVGTDAHDKKKLGKMQKIERFIQENNIPEQRVYGINGRMPIFKDKRKANEN